MTNNKLRAKTYSDTYLYNKNNLNYEKNLISFIMNAEEIDKSNSSFQDIRYDVKRRRISNSLLKVLDSKNTKLMIYPRPLPKAFKTFVAKDIKNDNKLKVFIDCDVIKSKNGVYGCHNIDILISYLVSAMNGLIYYIDPKRLVMREEIIKSGAEAFAHLFTNIIDYLYKISTIRDIKNKCLYLSAIYYQVNLLCKDLNNNVKSVAKRISGISDREEEILILQLENDSLSNIKLFIDCLRDILKLSKLTLDNFLEKWIYLYGVGTQFALELYPAFATMISNVYVGAYLNNQKTIEKIVTGRIVTSFTSAIFKVGSDLV